jgi:lyso-ornithine lipid O-acyltransferase
MSNPLLASCRLLALIAWTLPLLFMKIIGDMLRLPYARTLPRLWHLGTLRIMGIRLQRVGVVHKHRPVLFVANHASYLDIIILGALLPNASFVAKKEIEKWPVFGILAKLQETIFVERKVQLAKEHQQELAERLQENRSIIVFPEGTTSNGQYILPFKSTLFSVTDMAGVDLPIQPLTIAYLGLNGMALGRPLRPFVTWYGDMAMCDHLWRLLGLGVINVRLIFHEPQTASSFKNRKEIAAWAEEQVHGGLRLAFAAPVALGASRIRRLKIPKPNLRFIKRGQA